METYLSMMQEKIKTGELTWQQAFNWLQSHGMSATYLRKNLKLQSGELV